MTEGESQDQWKEAEIMTQLVLEKFQRIQIHVPNSKLSLIFFYHLVSILDNNALRDMSI